MGRHKKNESPNEKPNEKSEEELDSLSPEENQVVEEIEAHEEKPQSESFSFGGLLDRARDNLASGISEKPRATGKKYITKKDKETQENLATLAVSLFTMLIAAFNFPEDVKPNEADISGFSIPATRIILRHVNIAKGLTEDVIDAIAMIAAFSGYWMRTSKAWAVHNAERIAQARESMIYDNDLETGKV